MSEVTAEQVRDAMVSANITKVVVRECSMCGYPLAYHRAGEQLVFDSGCDCTGGGPTINSRTFFDITRFINMQSKPEIREQLSAQFGLPTGSKSDG